MAYDCEEQMGHETLLRYNHQNRRHNSFRIDGLGKTLIRIVLKNPWAFSPCSGVWYAKSLSISIVWHGAALEILIFIDFDKYWDTYFHFYSQNRELSRWRMRQQSSKMLLTGNFHWKYSNRPSIRIETKKSVERLLLIDNIAMKYCDLKVENWCTGFLRGLMPMNGLNLSRFWVKSDSRTPQRAFQALSKGIFPLFFSSRTTSTSTNTPKEPSDTPKKHTSQDTTKDSMSMMPQLEWAVWAISSGIQRCVWGWQGVCEVSIVFILYR